MPDAVTDTHALIWYLENSPRLSITANQFFEQCDRGEIIIYVPKPNHSDAITKSIKKYYKN
jgi:hypothetical protein